ncbi:energy transducer TonB [Mucilaginibacter mali]|uniref:Energy transducer TonB n=1 Tax=Mucilaginibacter mali TaxID=2740462 RepID=A0A7D4UN57_9SPHI|nr:energy transducer TonB [Mucilaginibacter mali]QKJ28660.1 energy transducer TonB [Mucilaginibacter mali]
MAIAQDKCVKEQDSILHKLVYKYTDIPPSTVGGMEKLGRTLTKNFKYPPGDADYAGRVIVAFVVEPNGKIDGLRTIKDPSGNKLIFAKQLYKIAAMLKWKPGTCNGKKVPAMFFLPANIDIAEQ